jgi:ribosome biogenesis protein UTP30
MLDLKSSTYCYSFFRSIKVGKMSQTPSHILENLLTALPAVAKAIKGGWDNIQNLAIKTNSSISLPIWSCTLDATEGGRWNGLKVEDVKDEDEDAESDLEEEEKEVKVVKEQASGKGKKRVTNSDEEVEEVEKPRKRSKAADGTPTTHMKVASALKTNKLAPTGVVTSSKKQKSAEIVTSPPKVVSTASGVSILKKKKTIKPVPSTLTNDVLSASPSRISASSPAQDKTKDRSLNSALIPPFGSATKTSISKKEMRQKRSATTIEKKKKILIKSKGGRSAKNTVLGKKVGQE